MVTVIVDPRDLAPGEVLFTSFNGEGMPICPGCRSDTLHSELAMHGLATMDRQGELHVRKEPRIYLHVLSGLECSRCGWKLLPGYRMGGADAA